MSTISSASPMPSDRTITVLGGTGFVGRALLARLVQLGHPTRAWVRNQARAASMLPPDTVLFSDNRRDTDPATDSLTQAVAGAHGIINLAGENIMAKRWSPRRKTQLTDSRVGLTRRLIKAMQAVPETEQRPRVLINASAVGYYGEDPATPVDEDSPAGNDFLAQLCLAWEREAQLAAPARVVCTRLGVVLGPGGGALKKLIPLFKMGLGGRLGNGSQGMAWVHLHDVVEGLLFCLNNDQAEGPVNLTAPEVTTNGDFTRALAQATKRWVGPPVPGFALRLALGDAAQALLTGQQAVPAKLERLGYRFTHRTLKKALMACVYQQPFNASP